jgi:predicted O-linked N-acetylglucosamine transferase (SPINDLY family)
MAINVKKALHKARTLTRRGDRAAAAKLYREVLTAYPQNREAINALADLQGRGGTLRSRAPAPSRESMNRVVALYQRGLLQEAYDAGSDLAERFPEDPVLQNFLGVVCAALQQPDAAVGHYDRAVALLPEYAEALCNLGICLQSMGRDTEAQQRYTAASRAEPDNASAQFGLAACLKASGDYRGAISHYRRCVELQPDHAAAHNNLGNCLQAVGDTRGAMASFQNAVRLNPSAADAHYNLAHRYFEQSQYAQARQAYATALDLDPDLADARSKLAHIDALLCDWQDTRGKVTAVQALGVSGGPVAPFALLALDGDPANQRLRATAYADEQFGSIRPLPDIAPAAESPTKLRIGYFSSDFYEHATMYLMVHLLELHDRDAFEVHAFSYGPTPRDAMHRRVRAAVDGFHDVLGTGDKQMALLARDLEIDIAIDLKGYTQNGRCGPFAYRAAPVQISYLGYPGTLALPAMDYIVADHRVIPREQAAHYTESIIYLPHSYQVNDSGREIAASCPARAEAGLPDTGFVFCCFNNSYKISPREFSIWMRLLDQVGGSCLWLLAGNPTVRDNLRREATQYGIDPDRLVFAEKMALADHLARHALADLFLDTFNYNAHTTASDALWAGLPVLTRPGSSFASRVGASLLTAVGLPELITDSDEAYEQLALSLARDPAQLADLRRRLQANRLSCPLFDTKRFTRDLERAYRLAWRRHQAGEAPGNIDVPADDQCR